MTSFGNADIREIDRFDKVSQIWWDLKGEMRTLHVINPLRLNFITESISLPNLRILDVGCGGGILTEALAKAGAYVTGIDLSKPSIQVASEHAKNQGLKIDYRYENIEEFASEFAGSFDVVTCMEMLEHVPDPEQIIAACSQALKQGGHAYFSTITRTPKAFLFAIVVGEYIIHLLPKGSHQYRRLITSQELKKWAGKHKLEFLRLASFIYNPFTGKFKLAPDREDVEYVVHFIKRN